MTTRLRSRKTPPHMAHIRLKTLQARRWCGQGLWPAFQSFGGDLGANRPLAQATRRISSRHAGMRSAEGFW